MTADSKDKVQYTTAVALLLSGMVLVYCSFFMHGEVMEGVLWYAGQTMVYAGSIFGVGMYIRTKTGEIKNYVDEQLNEVRHHNTDKQEEEA